MYAKVNDRPCKKGYIYIGIAEEANYLTFDAYVSSAWKDQTPEIYLEEGEIVSLSFSKDQYSVVCGWEEPRDFVVSEVVKIAPYNLGEFRMFNYRRYYLTPIKGIMKELTDSCTKEKQEEPEIEHNGFVCDCLAGQYGRRNREQGHSFSVNHVHCCYVGKVEGCSKSYCDYYGP